MSSIILGVSYSCSIKSMVGIKVFLYAVIETTALSKAVAISWCTSNLFSGLNGLAGSSLQRTTEETRKAGW